MSPLSLMTKLQTVFDLITSKNLYLMILAIVIFFIFNLIDNYFIMQLTKFKIVVI